MSQKWTPQHPKEKSKGLGSAVKIFFNISATTIRILLIKAACCCIEFTMCRTPHYMSITIETWSSRPCEVGSIFTPILQMRKLRHREVKDVSSVKALAVCLAGVWAQVVRFPRPGPKPLLLYITAVMSGSCHPVPWLSGLCLQVLPASLCPSFVPASLGLFKFSLLLGPSSHFYLFQGGLPNYFCL